MDPHTNTQASESEKKFLQCVLQRCQVEANKNHGGRIPPAYYAKIGGKKLKRCGPKVTANDIVIDSYQAGLGKSREGRNDKVKVKGSRKRTIELYRLVDCMKDHPFVDRQDVDVAAEAARLLDDAASNLPYEYYVFRKYCARYAPRLFKGNSPFLVLAIYFQPWEELEDSLDKAGVLNMKERMLVEEQLSPIIAKNTFKDKAIRIIRDYEQQEGALGWVDAFNAIQAKLHRKWSNQEVSKCPGAKQSWSSGNWQQVLTYTEANCNPSSKRW